MQTPYAADLAVLAALIDTGGPLDAAKIHIATVIPAPLTPNMVLTDFTEATFTGATAKAITWADPYLGPDGIPQTDSQLLTFTVTVDSPGSTITGWYLTDTAGTVLLAADAFATPILVPGVGSGFSFVIAYRRYDGITVVLET